MRVRKLLGKLALLLTGWKIEQPIPTARRFVLIAAPHTSNWDLVYLLALAWSVEVPISWLGKVQIFKPPFAGIMKWTGGVPVKRDRRNDLVSQIAKLFAEREEFIVVVPAEGTRSRAEYWKSGFYRMAQAANVPVYFGFLDYPTKTGGFGTYIDLTGDMKADMDKIRAFYSQKTGKHPEDFGPIRLREEEPGHGDA